MRNNDEVLGHMNGIDDVPDLLDDAFDDVPDDVDNE